jgi:hypothetical protein
MEQHSQTSFDVPVVPTPAPFVAYTRFPQAEAFLEAQLGERSRVRLPERQRELFVLVLPWVDLVFLPFHALAVLVVIGLSAFVTLIGRPSLLSAGISLAVFVLTALALPGLFQRKRRGWELHVYGAALGALSNLVHFSLIGLLMQVLVFWLAFQIKYRYQ